jgi:U2 small nuclear ribonucleoprotein A'
MRLTAELILNSSSYFNPIRERELDLRGNKISVIENLGATQDQYDCLDLSDNEIAKLDNFPLLNRVKGILINNNRIARIASNLGEQLPHLETLILSNNKIQNLNDIDPLADLPALRRLSLLDNIVTKKPHYRLYVIHKLPKLKLLDFRKIKEKERLASIKLFGAPDKSKKSNISVQSTDQVNELIQQDQAKVQAIKSAIANAKTLTEVEHLNRALEAGQVGEKN